MPITDTTTNRAYQKPNVANALSDDVARIRAGLDGIDTDVAALIARVNIATNGAASTPPGLFSGTWFSGGTATSTKPQLLIEPSGTTSTGWNTSGTGFGLNAPSGFTGRLLDLQLTGVSAFAVSSAGRLTAGQSGTLSNATTPGIEVTNDLVVNSSATGAGSQAGINLYHLVSNSTATRSGCRIASVAVASYTAGSAATNDADLSFFTTVDGSLLERTRITSAGGTVGTQITPAAVNVTGTLTIANIQTGIVTTTTAAAVDMTLPTGTNMDGGFYSTYTDMAVMWSVVNTGSNTATLIANTGHTIVGAAGVAAGTSGRFTSRRSGSATWITYRLS